MNYFNQNSDPMSTVQLSPFAEGQWHRIDTYSPISTNWTDMVPNTPQRTHRPMSGKLNVIDQIDINTLKLDDEILLNELHDIRRGSALLSRIKNVNREMKVLGTDEQEKSTLLLSDDPQTSLGNAHESKVTLKQSYTEPLFAYQQYNNNRPVSSNKSNPFQVKKFPHISFGPKPQPALAVQLRQSAIIRKNALLTANEQRLSTPVSNSTLKRPISSAHSSRQHPQQQELPLRHEINSIGSNDEQLTEDLSPSVRRTRIRSAHSSRSTAHIFKTRNDCTQQKQNVEFKSFLVKPWRQATWVDEIFDNSIPNSLDIMHKMCGPATAFERTLRHDYHKQLDLYRSASMKA